MNKIEYYLGIDLEDRDRFEDYVEFLNDMENWKFHIKIVNEFDDPQGYYTFVISGQWSSYEKFLKKSKEENSFVKSLNHFED